MWNAGISAENIMVKHSGTRKIRKNMFAAMAALLVCAVTVCGCGKQKAEEPVEYTYTDPYEEEDGTGTYVHDYSVSEQVVSNDSEATIDMISSEITEIWNSAEYKAMSYDSRINAIMEVMREKEADGVVDKDSTQFDEAANLLMFEVDGIIGGVMLSSD